MLISEINIDPILHSRARFLIIISLLEEEQTISSIAAMLAMNEAELDTELSKLQDAGYIEAKTGVWKSCVETKFLITESGISSFHHYTTDLERVIEWQKMQGRNSKTAICIKVDGLDTNVEINDIDYIKSCGNYVKINTATRTYVSPMTTSKVEQMLKENSFLRIHKSYIVNSAKIAAITEGKIQIGSISLPIGKTFKKFIEQFGKQYQIACH